MDHKKYMHIHSFLFSVILAEKQTKTKNKEKKNPKIKNCYFLHMSY